MDNEINQKVIEITTQMSTLAQGGNNENAITTVLVHRLAKCEVAFDRLSETMQKVIKAIMENENGRR